MIHPSPFIVPMLISVMPLRIQWPKICRCRSWCHKKMRYTRLPLSFILQKFLLPSSFFLKTRRVFPQSLNHKNFLNPHSFFLKLQKYFFLKPIFLISLRSNDFFFTTAGTPAAIASLTQVENYLLHKLI